MSNNNELRASRLCVNLESMQKAIDAAIEATRIDQATLDRVYALLYNTKVQGENASSSLVSSICSMACGILQRTRSADEGTLRVIKAHVDALAIIVEHDVAGDGGPLGQRMVAELRGLGQAMGA